MTWRDLSGAGGIKIMDIIFKIGFLWETQSPEPDFGTNLALQFRNCWFLTECWNLHSTLDCHLHKQSHDWSWTPEMCKYCWLTSGWSGSSCWLERAAQIVVGKGGVCWIPLPPHYLWWDHGFLLLGPRAAWMARLPCPSLASMGDKCQCKSHVLDPLVQCRVLVDSEQRILSFSFLKLEVSQEELTLKDRVIIYMSILNLRNQAVSGKMWRLPVTMS